LIAPVIINALVIVCSFAVLIAIYASIVKLQVSTLTALDGNERLNFRRDLRHSNDVSIWPLE
jgi:hypothetical protein